MKPVAIVLAVIGVVFLVLLFAGRSNRAQTAPDDSNARMELARTYRPPGVVTGVGALLGRWGPKVEFAQTSYTVAGAPVEVLVPPASEASERFRRATVRVAPPNCETVTIEYVAEPEDEPDPNLDRQAWRGTESDPCVGSIVVRPKGGMLTLACAAFQTCSITLE